MNRPAPVEITYECMRFLITHNPTNSQLVKFTEVRIKMGAVHMNSNIKYRVKADIDVFQELKSFGVQTLVRVCDATYDKTPVEKEGIEVLVRFVINLFKYPKDSDGILYFVCVYCRGFNTEMCFPLGLAF